MISVCIPTYNYDVRPLVKELANQAKELLVPVEILVVDDCSVNNDLKLKNMELRSLMHVEVLELERNVGRAAIRNFLAQQAKYPLLIFLDCDVMPQQSTFLQNYYSNRKENGVVVGGLAYREQYPGEAFSLRWTYGHLRESIDIDKRKQKPYASFMTGNFMISKLVFSMIQFDEELKGYGHEDTYFGIQLNDKEIEISHIDNKVYHDGLETNETFIEKTRKGIENLFSLYMKDSSNELFVSQNKLLSTYLLVRKWKLAGVLGLKFRIFERVMFRNLTSKKPSIRTFDWYKLGYLCFISKQKLI